jgi:hypothetical protein
MDSGTSRRNDWRLVDELPAWGEDRLGPSARYQPVWQAKGSYRLAASQWEQSAGSGRAGGRGGTTGGGRACSETALRRQTTRASDEGQNLPNQWPIVALSWSSLPLARFDATIHLPSRVSHLLIDARPPGILLRPWQQRAANGERRSPSPVGHVAHSRRRAREKRSKLERERRTLVLR